MKLKYTLAVGALALATAAQAQNWTPDTIPAGTAYAQDGFYNLVTGQVTQVDAADWDIAFITGSAFSASVIVNHYGGSTGATGTQRANKLYDLGLDATTRFGTDVTADTVGKTAATMRLENQPASWEDGAFNQGATGGLNFGWGDYDPTTHYTTGNKLFLLVNKSGAYQVWIEEYQASATAANRLWKFHVAKIDGTESAAYNFAPAPDYTNKLFGYFNVATRQFVNREPAMTDWHLLATRYPDAYSGAPGAGLQSTTGILTNVNVEVAMQANLLPDDADSAMAVAATYAADRNVIGGGYKVVNTSTFAWEVYDSLSYFIKMLDGVDSGDIYQIYFDYFPASTSGDVKIGLQKRKISNFTEEPPAPTAINNLNAYFSNVIVAPNPAVAGNTNLVLDVKQDIRNAQITIADLSGRVLHKVTKDIRAGFQQHRIDVSRYPAGIYMINISGAGFSTTQKLVIK